MTVDSLAHIRQCYEPALVWGHITLSHVLVHRWSADFNLRVAQEELGVGLQDGEMMERERGDTAAESSPNQQPVYLAADFLIGFQDVLKLFGQKVIERLDVLFYKPSDLLRAGSLRSTQQLTDTEQ